MDSAKNSSGNHSITEESQFQSYRYVLEVMKGKPVTIRTLDCGGDKLIKNTDIPVLQEQNPLFVTIIYECIRIPIILQRWFLESKRKHCNLYRTDLS
jgi:phosphoenolpyruvate-protein kinase (PTS system EI component)